ncbi:YihY/virulence factor BrkB family protein [Psychrobacillus sp. NEAU-3TGS]|uniref:YihY/virulence factor BrkB family protein n=1 Tax=Psychrobacillus sp. NEAU-3TGS TaxID=2995412 RepID=UPI00249824D2|nr:YihY/virulence factor BrkB family protein [Psychrobacillus sp. NEAU-3TGS]MDI2587110.1 YihY/virulence factor BrkB family protein [Psychrobacillus sp. NEAU-3TGS]
MDPEKEQEHNLKAHSSSSDNWFNKLKFLNMKKKDKKIEESQDLTTWKGYFKHLIVHIQKTDITGLAAQLAYFFLLSLFPLLIFIVTLLPYLNLDEAQVFRFLENYAPQDVYLLIEDTVSDILLTRNGGLLSIGIIGTIWSASNGMNAIVKSLNRSYNLDETRPFFIVRGLSVVFTLIMIVLFAVMLVLPVFGQQIGTILFSYFGFEDGFVKLWNSLRWAITPIIMLIVLTALYWIVPNQKLFLRSVFPGAIFATVGWIIVSLGFSYYVSNFGNYSSTYGSIGGIIVLMLWLYISGIMLLVGGQINAVTQERKIAIEKAEGKD